MNKGSRKNILFILGSLNIGGAEKVLINYVNAFKEKLDNYYNVEVFLISKDGDLLQYLNKNIKYNYLYLGNNFLPNNVLKRFLYKIYRKTISSLFKKFPFFYSLFFTQYSNFEFGFILVQDLFYFSRTSFGKIKYLWIQNNLLNIENSSIYNNNILYNSFEGVIANSAGIYNDLTQRIKLSEEKVFLCYNPVDLLSINEFSKNYIDQNKFNFKTHIPYMVTLGRAVHQKGFDILIDAFEIISKYNKHINLIVIGGGILEVELKSKVLSKNLEKRIHFIGAYSNPYPIVANSEFYISSSRYEGLPTSMIEAMSLGKVIISTPCDFGPKEILENGKFGILSEEITSNSLANSILKYLESDDEYKKNLTEKSIERSKYFSTDSSVSNLIKIIEKT